MSLKGVLIFLFVVILTGCSDKSLELNDGTQKSLSEYKGQWLLINYWAVWCKPCIEEIPELNHLDAQESISVIGYNFDRNIGEALAEQAKKLDIKFALTVRDPAMLFEQAVPGALPATMLIDPDGEFVEWLMGPQTGEGILAKIQKL